MLVLRIVLIAALTLATGAAGMYFGIQKERLAQEETLQYQASLSAKERIIAVASLDEGVSAGGVTTNFSQPILSSLGDVFVQTSYPLAEKGLAEGAYDAVVILPADFSEKVASVNSLNPQKVAVNYQINEKLPEAVYIETYQTLERFQADLNTTLSYMYLVSIYRELHNAQDESGKLLINNERNLSAIEIVELHNFVQTLNLGDLPKAELDIKTVDIGPYISSSAGIAKEMSEIYLGSYEDAKTAYAAMTTQLALDIQEAKQKGAEFLLAIDAGADWGVATSQYLCDVMDWLEGVEDWVLDSNDSLSTYRTSLKDSYQGFQDLYASRPTPPGGCTNPSCPNAAYINSANRMVRNASDLADDLAENVPEIYPYITDYPDGSHLADFPDIAAQNFALFEAAIDEVGATAGSYDPLTYLTSAHVSAASSLMERFTTDLGSAQAELSAQQADHLKQISDIYMQYNEYVGGLRVSVFESYLDALDQTDALKKGFVQTGKETTDENRALIGDFASRMPNSRSGEAVNQAVVEFVASPVVFTSADIRVPLAPPEAVSEDHLRLILLICIAAIVISLGLSITKNSIDKRKKEERPW